MSSVVGVAALSGVSSGRRLLRVAAATHPEDAVSEAVGALVDTSGDEVVALVQTVERAGSDILHSANNGADDSPDTAARVVALAVGLFDLHPLDRTVGRQVEGAVGLDLRGEGALRGLEDVVGSLRRSVGAGAVLDVGVVDAVGVEELPLVAVEVEHLAGSARELNLLLGLERLHELVDGLGVLWTGLLGHQRVDDTGLFLHLLRADQHPRDLVERITRASLVECGCHAAPIRLRGLAPPASVVRGSRSRLWPRVAVGATSSGRCPAPGWVLSGG
jgi:hypothetical protein